MVRDYVRKYRAFPSLTPERKTKLVKALSVGAFIEIACQRAGIVKDAFYRWMRASKALPHLGLDSPRYTPLPGPPAQ